MQSWEAENKILEGEREQMHLCRSEAFPGEGSSVLTQEPL